MLASARNRYDAIVAVVLRWCLVAMYEWSDKPDAFTVSPQFSVHVLAADDVYPLRVEQRGEFLDQWPEGFFDERCAELF